MSYILLHKRTAIYVYTILLIILKLILGFISILSKDALIILLKVLLWHLCFIFPGYMHRSGMLPSLDSYMFNFVRNYQKVFQDGGSATLYLQKPYPRILIAPQHGPHWCSGFS